MSSTKVTKYSPEFIQSLLTYLPIVIWSLDKNGVFTLSEGAGLAKLGLRPGEVDGQSVYELYKDYPEIINASKRSLQGETVSVTTEIGDAIYESRFTPLKDKNGIVSGTIGIAIDVTERVRGERELNSYALRVTKSNEALEDFVSTASHDLQEPIRNILNYLSLIQKEGANSFASSMKEYLGFALEAAGRMQALVKKLLSNTRPIATESDFQLVNCAEVVKKAEANLRWQIQESGAQINIGDLPSVHGNEIQLVQVFQNLISNGIKYHGSRSPIIDISATRDGAEWVISIKDNGNGFDPSATQRIFSLHHRIQRSEKAPGTGIGLAIVRRIVEYHGGRIWAETKKGEGATFFIGLPAA